MNYQPQLVQDFFHQQYHSVNLGFPPKLVAPIVHFQFTQKDTGFVFLLGGGGANVKKGAWFVIKEWFSGFHLPIKEQTLSMRSKFELANPYKSYSNINKLYFFTLCFTNEIQFPKDGRFHRLSGQHRHELDVKCWAMLFAHVAGFAAINCFGDLQQVELKFGVDAEQGRGTRFGRKDVSLFSSLFLLRSWLTSRY